MSEAAVAPECQAIRDAASDYVDGYVSGADRADFDAHLESCSGCVRFLEDLTSALGLLHRLCESPVSGKEEASAAALYEEYYPEPELPNDLNDWTPVKKAWGHLANLSSGERLSALRRVDSCLVPRLCDWLVVRARRTSLTNPDRAVVLAQTALYIARELQSHEQDGKRLFVSLQVLAWCLVSLKDFVPASEVLRELDGLRDIGIGREEEARLVVTKALYYGHTGRFDKAETLMRRAADLQEGNGGRRELVCALVNLSAAALIAGKVQKALDLCCEGVELLNPQEDPPRLQKVLFSNYVLALCEAGIAEEARRLLPRVKELARVVGGWYPALYAIWLEGTVSLAESRLARAGEIFEGVRREFLRREHLVWYVEASLDLSRVHLQRGNNGDLRSLASELVRRTQAVEVDGRVRSAVASFAEAVTQHSLTERVVSSIVIALTSARVGQRN